MSANKKGLCSISGERIKAELFGILNAPHAYNLLVDCNDIVADIICGFITDEFLLKNEGDTVTRLFSCVSRNSYEEICSICNKLRLNNAESEKLRMMQMLYNGILTRDGRKVIFDDIAKKALCEYKTDYIKSVFLFSDSYDKEFEEYLCNGIYELT